MGGIAMICGYPLGILTPREITNMSQAGLRAILAESQSSIAYIQRELNNPNISEETKIGMRTNMLQYQALVSAITAWLGLSPSQQAHTNGQNFIRSHQQQFIQQNQGSNNFLPGFDDLSFDIAGMPWYVGLGLAAAGVGIVYSMTKGKKR